MKTEVNAIKSITLQQKNFLEFNIRWKVRLPYDKLSVQTFSIYPDLHPDRGMWRPGRLRALSSRAN